MKITDIIVQLERVRVKCGQDHEAVTLELTLTPWSCRSSDPYRVRYVYTDGSLNYYNAYYGGNGVAPAFLLLPSLEVEVNTTKEENADV